MQNYIENVGELLIEKPLRRASPGDNLSTVVRAQTLSVLQGLDPDLKRMGLDPDRKRILLLFLYESGLIYKRKLVVSLVAANLTEANLREANLSGVDLSRADLSVANLIKANLSEANLREADLSSAFMREADLSRAHLAWANLRHTNLSGADLRKADLSGLTDLSGAYLSDAYVSKANLSGADLSGAYNLIYDEVVNKVTKQLIANKALEHRAKSLKGATMPNGHKYEDWLKSKDRTADRENE